jgi:nucleotide-binding universal stress UspA family protein
VEGIAMNQKTIAFEPKEILCPIDFSELSDLALKYAAAGARQFNANLTVFHAAHIELPRYFTEGVADQITEEINSSKRDIQAHMARHVESVLGSTAAKLPIKYKFMDSHPVDAILEAAGAGLTDLIVLGTRGFGGVKRLFMGSVAYGVLQSSTVPLFTVRQKEHDFIDVAKRDTVPQIRKILCPCNTTDSATLGLRYAASLSERFRAGLTVLNIFEGEEAPDSSRTEKDLCNWISGKIQAQCDMKTVVRHGNAAEQIIGYANEEKMDLIVIGARHHSLQGGIFFGRTTELVVRHAPLPVLTVPIA